MLCPEIKRFITSKKEDFDIGRVLNKYEEGDLIAVFYHSDVYNNNRIYFYVRTKTEYRELAEYIEFSKYLTTFNCKKQETNAETWAFVVLILSIVTICLSAIIFLVK